jgi:PAS domain S-box-containing protein
MTDPRPIAIRSARSDADDSRPSFPFDVVELDGGESTAALRDALSAAPCVLVDGLCSDLPGVLRRIRLADAEIQALVVTPADAREVLQRALLFTPGIGEIWFEAPDGIDAELVERAARVTATRREYRRTRGSVERQLASIRRASDQRSVVSDAYLAALLEAVPDPVISIDEEGVILSWNPAAERLLGVSRADALGRSLNAILQCEDGRAIPMLRPMDGSRTAVRRELRFRRGDGGDGVGELIVAPVEAAGHRVWAVVLRDLTAERLAQAEVEAQAIELEAQAEELQAQAEELQAQALELEEVNQELRVRGNELEHASRTRERFYSAMSHELRTPINAILGFIDLLLAGVYGEMPGSQTEGLVRAQRAARHLHELVDDVLDLARIEAGRMELRPEPTRLPDEIVETVESVRALAQRTGSEISIQGPDSHLLVTDARRLRQILLNLLSNAIKFGGGRPIRIRWEVRKNGGVGITVEDSGRGIAAEDLDRIFDEFTQVGDGTGGGTGLGLPISLRLARLMGGSLRATSALGEGSAFRLILPPELPAGDADLVHAEEERRSGSG